MSRIESLYDLNFSYEGDMFINEKKVSVHVNNESLEEILIFLFDNKFNFILLDSTIIITKKKKIIKKKNNISLTDIKFPKVEKLNLPLKIDSNENKKILPLQKLKFNNIIFIKDSLENNINSLLELVPYKAEKEERIMKIGCSISPVYKLSENSKNSYSFHIGTFFDFVLIDRLDALLGFSFYRTKIVNNKFNLTRLENANITDLSENVPRCYKSTINIIGMPIILRYNFLERKGTFFLTSGLSSIYLNMPFDYFYDEEKIKYGTYKKIGLFNFLILSCGYEKEFGLFNNFSFQIEPFAKFSLIRYSPEKINLKYFGLSVRINYCFKK